MFFYAVFAFFAVNLVLFLFSEVHLTFARIEFETPKSGHTQKKSARRSSPIKPSNSMPVSQND